MTGPEHYREAERLLKLADEHYVEAGAGLEQGAAVGDVEIFTRSVDSVVRIAQAHATLALAAPKPLPTVEIRRPHDEIIDLLIDGREVASANHDDHGWAGMAAFEKLAVTLVRAFGGEITEVEAAEDDDDE